MQTITRKYYDNIKDKLLLYAKSIEIDNRSGYQDANKDAENTFCFILNIIYDYQLENLNKIKNNFPGIDLGDDKNRISVQVTSENSKKKIQDTLDTFERKGYINTFDRLITQTSHTTSGNKALINAGWDTNQLISCVFTAFVILMASVLTPSIKMLTRLDRAVHSSMSCMSSQHT